LTDKAFLEDVQVGQRFVSGLHTIDAPQIVKFAREFDPQPFHVDPEAGARSFFKGLVASGWHTGAITMRLLVDGELQLAGGMIGGGGELTWPNATRPGDTLQVHSEVVAITPSRSKPDRGTITLRSETRNHRGEVVQVLTSRLIVPRRPGAATVPRATEPPSTP
jgi:acyl dehydratase